MGMMMMLIHYMLMVLMVLGWVMIAGSSFMTLSLLNPICVIFVNIVIVIIVIIIFFLFLSSFCLCLFFFFLELELFLRLGDTFS